MLVAKGRAAGLVGPPGWKLPVLTKAQFAALRLARRVGSPASLEKRPLRTARRLEGIRKTIFGPRPAGRRVAKRVIVAYLSRVTSPAPRLPLLLEIAAKGLARPKALSKVYGVRSPACARPAVGLADVSRLMAVAGVGPVGRRPSKTLKGAELSQPRTRRPRPVAKQRRQGQTTFCTPVRRLRQAGRT